MSEMVHYTGKISPVGKLPNETLEEQCERILKEHNYFELNSYCDSWREMLYCIFRNNCASVPEERSAIPLETEQSSAS